MVGTDLSRKAREALGYFEKALRRNGVEFWRAKDGAPQWVTDLCFVAHARGAMLPDDWRYEFIVQALNVLDEGSDLEPDINMSDLCSWLASNVNRVAFVDEAREERGAESLGIVEQLQYGQLAEKQEVLDQVTAFLEELTEDDEDEDQED
jgi:hypothetical protein